MLSLKTFVNKWMIISEEESPKLLVGKNDPTQTTTHSPFFLLYNPTISHSLSASRIILIPCRQQTSWKKMLTMSSIASSATPITTIKPKTHFTSSSLTSSFNGVRIAHVLPPPVTLSKRGGHSGGVVMMAKKEEELKEIRAKTTEEINEEIVDLKGELFMLRLQRSARNEFKSSEFRRMRKRVYSLSLFFC